GHGCGIPWRAGWRPHRTGVLVRQVEGRIALRLGPDQRLQRAADPRLDLQRRRPPAVSRAAAEARAERSRILRLPDADSAARLVQEAGEIRRRHEGLEVPY